jgi:hypothetical protein
MKQSMVERRWRVTVGLVDSELGVRVQWYVVRVWVTRGWSWNRKSAAQLEVQVQVAYNLELSMERSWTVSDKDILWPVRKEPT